MDAFDFREEPVEEPPERKPGKLLLRLGTIYFLISTLALAAFFVIVFLDPNSSLNPFPPPTPTATPETQSQALDDTAGSVAESAVPPAETATPTLDSEDETAMPTVTTAPYPTPTDVILATPISSETPEASLFFSAQEGSPSYLPYSGGCDGLYVAGNVIDIDNNPVMLMTIRAAGTLGDQTIDLEALSGSDPDYTASGWEIKLSDTLVDTSGTLSVALYAQGSRAPVSDIIFFDTFNDCSKNLVVVNYVQERSE
jgi:hypothetical protein